MSSKKYLEDNSKVQELQEQADATVQEVRLVDVKDKDVQDLLRSYPPELRNQLTATQHNVDRLIKILRNVEVDYNIPQICQGSECSQSGMCPLSERGMIGRPCPIEQVLIDRDIDRYKESLDIDDLDKVEMDSLMELVEADIMNRRASADIAQNGYVSRTVVAVTDDGRPIMKEDEAVALKVKAFYKKRRDRIIDDFAKSRKMQYKVGIRKPEVPSDPSSRAAELRKRAEDAAFDVTDDDKE